MKNVAANK